MSRRLVRENEGEPNFPRLGPSEFTDDRYDLAC